MEKLKRIAECLIAKKEGEMLQAPQEKKSNQTTAELDSHQTGLKTLYNLILEVKANSQLFSFRRND